MANKRWTCPECGDGKLAPGRRPHKEDSRYFCFPCSEEAGRLVRRTCAALDKKREAAKGRSKVKAQRKRERSVAKERAKDPFDMRSWFKRCQKLDAFKTFTWSRCTLTLFSGPRTQRYGSAAGSWEIRLNTASDKAQQLDTLVHEMAHTINYSRGGRGHDDGWRSAFGHGIYDLTGDHFAPSTHRYGDDATAVVEQWLIARGENEPHPSPSKSRAQPEYVEVCGDKVYITLRGSLREELEHQLELMKDCEPETVAAIPKQEHATKHWGRWVLPRELSRVANLYFWVEGAPTESPAWYRFTVQLFDLRCALENEALEIEAASD